MCIQAGAQSGLACYWSSWHNAVRDSAEMCRFLGMGDEDRCLGFLFFIVAACDPGFTWTTGQPHAARRFPYERRVARLMLKQKF